MLSVEREPVVAGTFYNSDPAELIVQLKKCFDGVQEAVQRCVSALIVPHAGYSYSGKVAASAYALVDQEAEFDNVFIIGSSHHVAFNGASVYNKGHYKTPLGVVPVNLDIANDLISKSKNMLFNKEAHSEEHTIEVQLPFLQYRIKNLKHIVPIVIGVKDYAHCKKIAEDLRPYFNSKNLFVFSTDFSHYPSDDDARRVDEGTVNAICSNKPKVLIKELEKKEVRNIPNLFTGLCGWSSILTLLYLTEGESRYQYKKIKYMTSGETQFRNKDRVVGYQSILIVDNGRDEMGISEKKKNMLLQIARQAIKRQLGVKVDESGFIVDDSIKHLDSAFVSVYVGSNLRGCIGQFTSSHSLPELVAELAVSSAFNDGRFTPISKKELDDITIEISVLTPMRKIHSIEDIELGKHGVYLKKGDRKGTFLPQVATKTGWNLEEFLGHLARDKAHVGWLGWQDADLYVFEAIVFSD
ncbi:AmmeMemoRadiSam system protein B [Saccharicrinis sp. GN24d3]|uniref:AmmeMemoRadiSam system protein B n=1 Tax=Saccharicrinis sp. GN24d3 TaxID=3458416 RepID=UPI004036DD83